MSNETFLIPIRQNNDLSDIALAELRQDLDLHPLNQRLYTKLAYLAGNSKKYSLNSQATEIGPLLGKRILFLGSSVTFGFGALGESFVDFLWKKDGVEAIKDAENGTTLVEEDVNYPGDSYVARFEENLKLEAPEMLVLQLSTNDAQKNKKLGQISKDDNFDTQTITGALEYIISNARKKWNCPILLYTSSYFDNALYSQMVKRSYELVKKYSIEILDLYNDSNFKKQDKLYMADKIHPTRAGYKEKWLPKFENKLSSMLDIKKD